MYNYRQILKQAFKTVWQSPGLWFFGLFAALLGNSAELDLILNSYGFGSQGIFASFYSGLADSGLFTKTGLSNAFSLLTKQPVYVFLILLLLLLVLAIAIFFIWLTIVSQSALVSQGLGVNKNQPFGLRRGFQTGIEKFWPVFFLNVITRLLTIALFGFLWLIAIIKFKYSAVIFVLGFILFFVAIVVVSFISRYAICGVVLKDWRFFQSIGSAWLVFKRNWLLSLEVMVILSLIYLAINSLLFFLTATILVYLLGIYAGFTFGLIVMGLFLLFGFLAVEIILTIFNWTTWAIVFELLTSKRQVVMSFIASIFRK